MESGLEWIGSVNGQQLLAGVLACYYTTEKAKMNCQMHKHDQFWRLDDHE